MYEQLSSCVTNIDSQAGSLFLLLINTLFASQCEMTDPKLYPPDRSSSLKDGDSFDFIVVGAGSAGSVVGNRLVEVGKWSVLVLEAGGIPSLTAQIPLLFFNIELTDQTWDYYTERSRNSCLGLRSGACHWPRGKLLGGCSSINAMLYIRGNKKNYDSWAENGNEGWDYENLLKYFKRSERLMATNLQHLDSYGKKGLLPLTNYKSNDPVRDIIFDSVKEIGYPILEEEGPNGFFECLQTVEDGVRANAAKVFLGSVKDSKRITLVQNTHVKRVLINEITKQATGVEVEIDGKTLKVYNRKEVVLSAGAINSPQLLMLSGIGPREHLKGLDIDVIQDLKVGKHLQDHMMFLMFSKVNDEAFEQVDSQNELFKYFSHQDSTFGKLGITNIQGFISTKNASNFPDIQYTYLGFPKNDLSAINTFTEVINLDIETAKKLKYYNSRHNIVGTVIILLQPKSTGEVLLRNKDPLVEPIIRSGYLTDMDGYDLETMLKGVRIAEAQIRTKSFKEVGAEVLDINIPNCGKHEFDSDDYWRCAIRNIGTTLYHPTGTCKMGPKSDTDAVVDAKLKVHGIDKLRVIDASIMPNIVSGNTNGPTIMIGQKGSQIIIDDYLDQCMKKYEVQDKHNGEI
ncbi:hypothetical protein HHI36_021804 [Cryptolaemus montrouzieri]|uniref:Glucose-methanol-choline oxidoreductase N-terminal domain-containing protein n=1 Tax=Cryptolaemus montrouzieri TaxID=559131 RepID=A0ABD2MY77_9CUCU